MIKPKILRSKAERHDDEMYAREMLLVRIARGEERTYGRIR